jgi:hypothetical protein
VLTLAAGSSTQEALPFTGLDDSTGTTFLCDDRDSWVAFQLAGTEVSVAVRGKMDAMSGEKKRLKWVMAGSSRDLSYTENGYQYVIRSGDKEYVAPKDALGGDKPQAGLRHQTAGLRAGRELGCRGRTESMRD